MNREPIDDDEMVRLIFPMMDERNRRIFDEDGGADFAHTTDVDGKRWRFRVNVLQQMGHVGMVARRVNNWIPPLEELYLPTVLYELCKYSQAAPLADQVRKSTTIASILNFNQNYRKHILTLEDPIDSRSPRTSAYQPARDRHGRQLLHRYKHAVREIPCDARGEMRDRETFETAIHVAETGHLVFGTIHASTAASTIINLDLFPASMHSAIWRWRST